MSEWHESMRPVIGYPVILTGNESSLHWGNASLIAHQGDSMQDLSGASQQHAANSGQVKKLVPYVDPLPKPTAVKPTHRPIFPRSRKNVDTVDEQEERDRRKFMSTGHKYWAHTPQAYHHHHKPLLSGCCPEDHVYPDRGRHKPGWCASTSLFDPITATSRPIGSPGRVDLRPSSAPPQQPVTAGSSNSSLAVAQQPQTLCRPGTARAAQGRYNPLTHTWIEQPEPAAQAVRQKESDRIHGAAIGFIGIRSPTRKAAALQPPWAGCCDNLSDTDTGAAADGKPSGGGSSSSSSSSAPPKMQRRSSLRYHGESWGTYNIFQHKWEVPPKDQRFAAAEAAPHGLHFDRSSTSHTKQVPRPSSQGVYDPIRGQWKEPPANKRVLAGLEFAPRQLFDKECFVKR